MFLWGFVYWGPALNMTPRLMTRLPESAERDVLPPLRAARTPDGMYVYPGPLAGAADEAAQTAWEQQLADGPVLHLAYRERGVSPLDPTMFAKGLAHCILQALLAALLLAVAAPALPRYRSRVAVLALAGALAAVSTNGDNLIWRFYSPQYTAGQAAYTLVGALLAALIIAAIVRPQAAKTADA